MIRPEDSPISAARKDEKGCSHFRSCCRGAYHASSALAKLAAREHCLAVPMLGGRRGRRKYHLSPGSPAIHRQADCAGPELRRPGRHRHREHAAAQRMRQRTTTTIAGAADGDGDVLQRDQSSSPGELEPVFDAMLENATRICDAKFGVLQLCEDGGFRMVAMHNAPPAYAESRRRAPLIASGPVTGLRASPRPNSCSTSSIWLGGGLSGGRSCGRSFVEMAGVRTLLVVPMLKERELVGAISVYRQEVGRSPTSRSSWCRISPPRPSSPSRTRDCSTSCAAHTICWSSRRQPRKCCRSSVHRPAIWSRCSSPCWRMRRVSAKPSSASLFSFDGEMFEFAAEVGTPPEFGKFMRQRGPFSPVPGSLLERVLQTKQVSPHRSIMPPRIRRISGRSGSAVPDRRSPCQCSRTASWSA